ncbi:MAG: UDP-N-acetylmuramoyl-L-alanine--D-glutamate ligase [bacterium]|nr:UDP-N-acetylmuramoyl-L-alanine--D-glutamate ligase [bacterium]
MKLPEFKGKKVLVMGLGLHGGGVGSAEFFSHLGSRVIATDLKSQRELAPSVAKLRRFRNIAYHLGGHRAADFRSADFIIQGPGVPQNSKFLKIAKRSGVPVLSDVEIFFLACSAPIIGITGTKGKSTTTWLLGQMLKAERRRRVWVGGNIRKSMLDFLGRVKKNDLVVLELSSFQLDSLSQSRRSPQIALITNVFPDHLNRYASLAAYARSKAGIFRFQKPGDHLFINQKDAVLHRIAAQAKSRVIRFNPRTIARHYRSVLSKRIPDFHLPNIAAAVAVARHLGVGERAIQDVLRHFRGVPSRMQLVRKVDGVEFINDTTATNPEAARQAVIATKRRIGRRRLVVIAGGYDKRLPIGDFMSALAKHAAAVIFLPGTATKKMKAKVKNERLKVWSAKTMQQAVRLAYRAAKPAGTVLLSPGAASFGLFRHEFDRGEQFTKAVRALR